MNVANPQRRSVRALTAPFGIAILGMLVCVSACSRESRAESAQSGETPRVSASSAADSNASELPAEVRATIDRELERLLGTATEPRFEAASAWSSRSFDPAVDGRGSDESSREAFAKSNELRFQLELEHLRAGDWEAVHLPAHMLNVLLEIRRRAEATARSQRSAKANEEVARLVLDWYPSLVDAGRIFRLNCASCHGPLGAGNGPQAETCDPKPRDLRRGLFKFTSRLSRVKPTRDDLRRTLERGLTGTGMPSSSWLSRAELEGLVDYVRWLSIRGGVEHELAAGFEVDGEIGKDAGGEAYESAWKAWLDAPSKPVPVPESVPPQSSELIARGKELYHDAAKGNCAQCHGDQGLGDGPASFKVAENGAREPVRDDWGFAIKPRNFVEGVFRAGRDPRDVFCRVYAGINGTPMPAAGEAKDASGARVLSDDDIWALVAYVLSLKR